MATLRQRAENLKRALERQKAIINMRKEGKTLQEIGEAMLEAKKTAPKRPSQPSALKKTIDAVIS